MTTRAPLSTITVIVEIDGKEARRFDATKAHLLKMSPLHLADTFKRDGVSSVVFVRTDRVAEPAVFASIEEAKQILKRFGIAKARHSPIFTLAVKSHEDPQE